MLDEFVAPFRAKDERTVLANLEARVAAKDDEIATADKKVPGMSPKEVWRVKKRVVLLSQDG